MPSKSQSPAGTITANASLLMILRPKKESHERHVVFIESPQARARNEPYRSLPKGTFEASGNVTGPMMEKVGQELGLKVRKDELINLTSLVMQHPHCRQGRNPDSVINPAYITPHKPVILWEKRFDTKEIEDLIGRFGDKRAHNEASNLRVLDYRNLWKEGVRNAELMAAWAMYENLSFKGKLQEQLHNVAIGSSVKSTR